MEYTFVIEEIGNINADLNIIAKYHDGTRSLLNPNKSNIINATANIRLLYKIDGEEAYITNDFNIGKVTHKVQIEESHLQNLFVLLRNMNDVEWGYYQAHFSSDDAINGINLNAELKSLITDLKVLKAQLSTDEILETKIKLRELKKVGKSEVPYDVRGMGVTVNGLDENKQLIKVILKNRIKQIQDISYLYYHITDSHPSGWNDDLTDEILEYLQQPFPDYRARWLFGRYATQKILAYLKAETTLQEKDIEVTQSQAVLIYTLFLLFGVIDIKIENDIPVSKSDRDKAKLIRSFLRQDLKDKEVEFYNLTFTPFINKI
ncbi:MULTISPECIES: hypothetical protein [Pedobacter]|uniref:hypothetical protein n=1 Tax=Pedobacter TaxID=84567 RepID=UPI0004932F98|nr:MULTISPECIES: hypothetical protein [Pedobacter]